MKNYLISSLVLVAVAALTGSARAQILWTSVGTITGLSDISTDGSYFDALQTSTNVNFNKKEQTIGDTVFHVINTNGTEADGLIAITGSNTTGFDGSFTSAPPSSAAYAAVLGGNAFVQNKSGTIVLSGLTFGDVYQVEVWNSTKHSTTYDAGTITPAILTGGDFALGTFTATASTHSFTFANSVGGDTYGVIDAIAVRDITQVPEPSTWALMLGGMGFLVLLARRHGLKA